MAYEFTPNEYDEERDLYKIDFWPLNGVHSIPVWTPAYAWTWYHHWCPGVRWAAEKLSLPNEKGFAAVQRDGVAYQSPIIITDEAIKKQREPAFREKITPWIEDYDKEWGKTVAEMQGYYDRLDPVDVTSLSNVDLWDHFDDILKLNWRMIQLHFLAMYPAYYLVTLFEDMCRTLVGIDDTHPLFLKAITGVETELQKTDRMLWRLSERAGEFGLAEVFQTTPEDQMLATLEESDAGRQWRTEFDEFLQARGWRIPRFTEFAWKTSAPWREDPTPAITHIKQFLAKGGKFSLDEEHNRLSKERLEAAEEIIASVPEDQRQWFRKLLSLAQKGNAFGPDHNHWLDHHTTGLYRRVYLEIGRRFAEAGAIDETDDIFFLVPDDIVIGILLPELYTFRHIVKRRKEQREENMKKTYLPIFGRKDFIEAAPLINQELILNKIVVGSMPVYKPDLKADLQGVCGSSGEAEGTARVIFSPDEFAKVQPDDILVTMTTYSSWTPLFSIIRGAVIDRGGSMCHAAIVGREVGIPVVLNVFEGTTKIKSGQRIRINGDLGTVHILD